MINLKALLVDDEDRNNAVLKALLKDYCSDVEVCATASEVDEAFSLIVKHRPDVVFLDIELAGGNAFSLLDKFEDIFFQIIFVSAFDEYALKAFRYSALDYLLKPIDLAELQAALEKLRERIQEGAANNLMRHMAHQMKNIATGFKTIAIPTVDDIIFLDTAQIVRLAAHGSYTHFFTTDREKIISSKSIKEYEEMLPENKFYRIHNSHIVNIAAVKKYLKGRGGFVVLEDGTKVEVADRRKDGFLKLFGIR
jgi:two-component system, LytTR family, response regulator